MIRLAISADCHVTEPHDLWTANLPPGQRDRGPRLEWRDGRGCFVAENRVIRKLPPLGGETQQLPDGAPPPFWNADDPSTRLRALEQDGVWAEVLYPNVAFFCTFAIEDAELQVGTCRVYNDWLAATFGGSDRHAPIGMLPILDLGASVTELERLVGLGLRGALLPTHADFRPYNDPAYEPLWEAAAGLGVPLSFHAGTGRSQTPARGPGAAVVNYVATVSSPMETVAYLSASGVLERHPRLRVGMVECGAGWLAWTLDAMDDAYREHQAWVRPKLAELPSESFRRQGFVTFQRDPVGLANLERTGTGCLLWGSDHPHPEGTFPESRRILEEQFAGLPQEATDAIVYRNTAGLYRIPLPEPGPAWQVPETLG
jgi:predicted TIM-barrel fold metal-dependent hydrolase